MIKTEFLAMGCRMAVLLENDHPQAVRALQEVPSWFEEWEQALSRFRPDSDLNQLNAAAGMEVQVNPILWDAVRTALRLARWSDGLVVPTVLRSLEHAGYDRSFDIIHSGHPGHLPAAQTALLEDWPSLLSAWQKIRMDEKTRTISLPPEAKLDLGGVGKGWAAQQAMQRLKKFGPVLVDASGDIAISDCLPEGSPWLIDVADPLKMQEKLDMLALGGCGVATSGIDFRRWRKDGIWKHHIIDPRSGEPAVTDLMSVTVIAPDTLQAEAAAKAVLILGSQAGMNWLEEKPQLAGLLAMNDGRLLYSQQVRPYLWG